MKIAGKFLVSVKRIKLNSEIFCQFSLFGLIGNTASKALTPFKWQFYDAANLNELYFYCHNAKRQKMPFNIVSY